MSPRRRHLISLFVRHRVAANLLMLMMILAGAWALSQLNIQFAPNYEPRQISVEVLWNGAAAEDMASSVIAPLEQALRGLDNLKRMSSVARNGLAEVNLEFEAGTDMGLALDQVKEEVALIRNLPPDSEKPEIRKAVRYELIARVLLVGSESLAALRPLARQVERQLLERGIARLSLNGLPEEEIAIQVPAATLARLNLGLPELAKRLASHSRDLPAGSVGRRDAARLLRGLEQRREAQAFLDLPLIADYQGRLLRLGDLGTVERRPRPNQTLVWYQGRPAVEFNLYRAGQANALESAEILREWLEDFRPTLPAGVEVLAYDQSWKMLQQRIGLLVENGLSGLVLILLILFLFLRAPVAWWVAVGVPVSLLAMLAVLYLLNGSINMYSLFAMIMALGIIVDDAIVVGEDTWSRYQRGAAPLAAAEQGARRMFMLVLAASLTTIGAFLPLMLMGGMLGNLVFEIPLVVICAILASLVESFLILPGHLRHGLGRSRETPPSRFRQGMDRGFERFRENLFRPLVRIALKYRWTTLALPPALLILAVGLVVGGRIPFTFFGDVESSTLSANAGFVAGTPPARLDAFAEHLRASLRQTEQQLGENLVSVAVVRRGLVIRNEWEGPEYSERYVSLMVELGEPESRSVRAREFIRAWEANIHETPGLESFSINELRTGPPGRDLDIQLYGDDPGVLKQAARELAARLRGIAGVSAVEDNLPYGREQLIYHLTPEAYMHGLTVAEVGRQLRAAYDGHLAQIFLEGQEELEVRVGLPEQERDDLASLGRLPITLPDGGHIPLADAVTWRTQPGFEILRHHRGRLAARVMGDVDETVNNANQILADLEQAFLPALQTRYGVSYRLEGRAADQAETFGDMGWGLIVGLALMYLILGWVFASYGWPLLVMAVIPFSLVGAVFGHWLMGLDLTVISLLGLFGLAGIVVNDSIVLTVFYRGLREAGESARAALEEAACQRLRAVLLTSLTTLGGLLPLLLETSWQARFLIPMAVSIAFGLLFATLLVLLVLPALLSLYEDFFQQAE